VPEIPFESALQQHRRAGGPALRSAGRDAHGFGSLGASGSRVQKKTTDLVSWRVPLDSSRRRVIRAG